MRLETPVELSQSHFVSVMYNLVSSLQSKSLGCYIGLQKKHNIGLVVQRKMSRDQYERDCTGPCAHVAHEENVKRSTTRQILNVVVGVVKTALENFQTIYVNVFPT